MDRLGITAHIGVGMVIGDPHGILVIIPDITPDIIITRRIMPDLQHIALQAREHIVLHVPVNAMTVMHQVVAPVIATTIMPITVQIVRVAATTARRYHHKAVDLQAAAIRVCHLPKVVATRRATMDILVLQTAIATVAHIHAPQTAVVVEVDFQAVAAEVDVVAEAVEVDAIKKLYKI